MKQRIAPDGNVTGYSVAMPGDRNPRPATGVVLRYPTRTGPIAPACARTLAATGPVVGDGAGGDVERGGGEGPRGC